MVHAICITQETYTHKHILNWWLGKGCNHAPTTVFSSLNLNSITTLPFWYWAFIITLFSCLQYRKSWKKNFYRTMVFHVNRKLWDIRNIVAAFLSVYYAANITIMLHLGIHADTEYESTHSTMILTPWLLVPSAWKKICISELFSGFLQWFPILQYFWVILSTPCPTIHCSYSRIFPSHKWSSDTTRRVQQALNYETHQLFLHRYGYKSITTLTFLIVKGYLQQQLKVWDTKRAS